MSDRDELGAGLLPGEPFEVQVRGYSRRQVDEFAARSRDHARHLTDQLSRAAGEIERLRAELAAAQQQAAGRPVHEELSERIAQILKLADAEARDQRARTDQEIAALHAQAQHDADARRAAAASQAEQMLATAQAEAAQALASAQAEASSLTETTRAQAEQTAATARSQAEKAIAEATGAARQMVDEAAARAAAIADGAERRLTLLTSRHGEVVRELTQIGAAVTELVAHDTARGSLEDEVAAAAAAILATASQAAGAGTQTAGGGSAAPGTAAPAARSPAGPPPAPPPAEARSLPSGTERAHE